jgi:hypothetical protein
MKLEEVALLGRKYMSRVSRGCAEREMYYIHQTPREVPLGLILMHNFPRPTRRHKIGEDGWRVFFIPDKGRKRTPCNCGWAPSLIHYGGAKTRAATEARKAKRAEEKKEVSQRPTEFV